MTCLSTRTISNCRRSVLRNNLVDRMCLYRICCCFLGYVLMPLCISLDHYNDNDIPTLLLHQASYDACFRKRDANMGGMYATSES